MNFEKITKVKDVHGDFRTGFNDLSFDHDKKKDD